MGFRVYGRENLPKTGGAIIASNHQSFLDPVALGAAADRQLRYLARRTLFENPAFAALIRSLGALEFGRDGVDAAGAREMIAALERGELVAMFPEGTRTTDGKIGRIKPGVGLLARRACVPVVPAALDGLYKAWPRTRKYPGVRGPIRVAFGEPIQPIEGKSSDEKIQEELSEKMRNLFRFLRRKA
jgi:1-acyl-sn-glycerol-3-phosphate acyltransferase